MDTNSHDVLDIHRGAIDRTTITTQPPKEVISKIKSVLDSIGINAQPESAFRYRCIRPSQANSGSESSLNANDLVSYFETILLINAYMNVLQHALNTLTSPIYSTDPSRDPAGEVRFSVELTRLAGLNDTYCLDIRRLKGNLRSYQFLYETIRE
ncbi:hypothetical protein AGABI1DRAFT_78304 [Agaricus bisporus var. burnettii JB137-S8]|uniref:non-specific serine/threonine protein kinase n=1 Tax=Agaricus bisporus var. burnettii (strain JB137-S8 / ATCC MYA-4627 / FGSC 10392) TaxID=597362 RepID=K5VQ51_AGABU|nr:uncharacterized protein AGABI1DRAFT_78304 [Agaricus bisporus var. burnettii JB137-S8]EKM76569.1 hypothetical protein AGABI1DRAFT_78304 [Agaricus bisporus var. burnettii JB137-S8]